MHDVVVVGGGPAGCYTASLLGQSGFDVHVLEEHPVIGEPVDCSGVIGAEAFTLLGLPNSIKLSEISRLTFVSPSALEVHFSPRSPLACVVDRAAFDRVIAEKSAASGVTFHLGSRVVDLELRDDCVEVLVEELETSDVGHGSPNIRPSSFLASKPTRLGSWEARKPESYSPFTIHSQKLRAKMAVLANGPRYKFQRKLGMGQPGALLRTAQAEAPIRGIKNAKVLTGSQVAPGSFAWIVPFQRGDEKFARVGVSAGTSALPCLKRLIHNLYDAGHLSSPDVSIRSWIIPIRPLRRTFSDRVLAVGDAAGQTKPTTGGGLFYGLLSAEAAAHTAIQAFKKGDFSTGTLSGYEKEWRRRLGREIKIGTLFRRLAERLTDQEIDDLFRVIQSDGILSALTGKARFDWHKDIIYFILRHPALGRIFLKGLLR